jgi:hypothetical protein
VRLRIEFAHGSLRPVSSRPVPARPVSSRPVERDDAIEAFVRARVTALDGAGEPLGWVAWPEVRVLGDAVGAWRWAPLPGLLEGLASEGRRARGGRAPARTGDAPASAPGEGGPTHAATVAPWPEPAPKLEVPKLEVPKLEVPKLEMPELEAHVPAEVQEHLRRDAPRTWQHLLQNTRLLQRGECYRLAIVQGALAIEHRPAGAGSPRRLGSELLALAWGLRRGDRFSGPESLLLGELLRARWLHRRLPPGLRWNAADQRTSLRSDPELRLGERLDARGIPIELELAAGDPEAPRVLPCAPGDGLPGGVVRAALGWVLGHAREGEELYLDPSGVLPREEPEVAGARAGVLAQI